MAEVLRKNEYRAEMETTKIFTQACMVAFFALFLAVYKKEITGMSLTFSVGVSAILCVGLLKLRRKYIMLGKLLDIEDAKERELTQTTSKQ